MPRLGFLVFCLSSSTAVGRYFYILVLKKCSIDLPIDLFCTYMVPKWNELLHWQRFDKGHVVVLQAEDRRIEPHFLTISLQQTILFCKSHSTTCLCHEKCWPHTPMILPPLYHPGK